MQNFTAVHLNELLHLFRKISSRNSVFLVLWVNSENEFVRLEKHRQHFLIKKKNSPSTKF